MVSANQPSSPKFRVQPTWGFGHLRLVRSHCCPATAKMLWENQNLANGENVKQTLRFSMQMHYNLVNEHGWLGKSTWTLFSIDYVTRWWLNQPTIWNILLVKWNIFPNFQGVKSKQTCLKPPRSEKKRGWVGGSYMDFKLVTNHHFESASSWVIQPKLETFHISRK